MTINPYTTSREDAAAALGVSTRTLDRWLRAGKLRSKTINRTVWVHTSDTDTAAQKAGHKSSKRGASSSSQSAAEPTVTVENHSAEKTFQQLYTETASELRAKQEKLEAASFRVGQLEAQLQNSVPLLEYKQKEETYQAEKNSLLQNIEGTKRQNLWLMVGLACLVPLVIVLAIAITL
jgi:hypothetical protein